MHIYIIQSHGWSVFGIRPTQAPASGRDPKKRTQHTVAHQLECFSDAHLAET